jgi:hypothetical protein
MFWAVTFGKNFPDFYETYHIQRTTWAKKNITHNLILQM